ncbi:MAG TPA: SRPBCC family protein, partial [Thermoleophilaceae bacterium]
MTMQTTDLVVRKTVTVEAPQEHAFDVFTAGFDKWWPRSHHIGEAEMAEAIIECREGGRAYERGVDGSECEWGRVLVFDRPNRVVVSWHLQGDWSYDPDPSKASEYEARFIPETDSRTRVEFEHRHLERHGEAAQHIYDQVSQEGGWGGLLAMYAKEAAVSGS